ncbi:MAG: aryl-sulfate sulfotransferase [Myxococcota bacterium]
MGARRAARPAARPAGPRARRLGPRRRRPSGRVPVDAFALHHEAFPLPDGFLTLDLRDFDDDAYPVSYDRPAGPLRPATIVDALVLDVATDGTVRSRWSLAERLDTQRIGWMSLQVDAGGLDWAHANAVFLDPTDGNVVVSVRHQDVVVELDRATGDVRWLLGNPDGWAPPLADLRLQPVGDVSWPSHQHGPMIVDNGDGTIDVVMFDNGNYGRTTPYSGVDDGDHYSRMIAYRVDEAARTVEQVWVADETSTGRLFVPAFGDADRLPLTGNTLGVWGMVFDEGEGKNVDLGRGAKSVRLVEAGPDGAPVWELSAWTPREAWREGWQAHRAQRIPTLYPR